MKNICRNIAFLSLGLVLFNSVEALGSQRQRPASLNTFRFHAASVLPTCPCKAFIDGKLQETTCAVLAREAGGPDKGTYDDFGGKRDKGENPQQTAAREFYEEANLKRTLSMDCKDSEQYIDPNNDNTKYVIAQERAGSRRGGTSYVTYITQFKSEYINQLKESFFNRPKDTWLLKIPWNRKYREKDSIALVPLSVLKHNIIQNKHIVSAMVYDPLKKVDVQQDILLRPIFVSKLFNFFSKRPYEVDSTNDKIRFYKRELNNLPAGFVHACSRGY